MPLLRINHTFRRRQPILRQNRKPQRSPKNLDLGRVGGENVKPDIDDFPYDNDQSPEHPEDQDLSDSSEGTPPPIQPSRGLSRWLASH